MSKTTAIICAYNEENTIIDLLQNVCSIALFDEIVVVNDGSTDKTAMLIKEFKLNFNIHDLHLQKNRGKGFAMAKGILLSKSENLVFIDADLSNFTTQHASQLIEPLEKQEADMVLGQPTDTLIKHELNPFKTLSGQRSVKKTDIFPIIDRMKYSGYGVETLINMHFKANNKTVKYVKLDKLIHPTKFQKTTPKHAFKGFVKEACQIVVTAFTNFDLSMLAISNRF